MSASVVGKEHINAMIRAGLHGHYGPLHYYWNKEAKVLNEETADEIGQMLLEENVKSVCYRYQDSELTNLPGKVNAEWLIPFTYRIMLEAPTAVEAIKIIQCYKYQSCEDPEWEASEAFAFCEALTHAQYDRLPGYDAAPWEWTKPIENRSIWRIM